MAFGDQQQLERHHEPGGARPGALRHAFAQPDGGERRLDRIRIRYERRGATPSPSSLFAMRYGATIRDRGTWEHAGWAGR